MVWVQLAGVVCGVGVISTLLGVLAFFAGIEVTLPPRREGGRS